ncbi:hypothetical protein SN811_00480 [Ligilactobacillus agilis]|uniref:ABC transporter permease n=1 Tax=Ligilactobacillus agilis TaxID=1601 RepID=A0A6F9Y286_9LACO|nr:hypothetical protein [Ligilactobacillus agilis]GET11548.1 hypothetical protein SN811_00480 [Ligilactobacillus agilis]
MRSYLALVIFNFKRLFKHWSSFILIISVVLVTVVLCLVNNYNSYKYVKTVPNMYEENFKNSEYFRPATKRYKPDVILKISNRKLDYKVVISKNHQINSNEEKEIIAILKQEINSRFIVQNKLLLPKFHIVRKFKVSENKNGPVVLLGVYTLLLLIGIMTFMAVSAEKIDKMLFLISSKVSFKKVIYSKVMAIFLFIVGLCFCILLTLVILNFTKYFSLQTFFQKLSESELIILLKVSSLVFIGILQTICIYGFFALLIDDSTQLQTGMMIPTIFELMAWLGAFSINIGYLQFRSMSKQLNWIPLFNVLLGIENSLTKISVHFESVFISTLILLIIFDVFIYRITKLKSESQLLME